MKFHIYKNKEKLCEELAIWMCDVIDSTLQNQEFFTLALSCGETPKIFFKKLASAEFLNNINCKRVHILGCDKVAVRFKIKSKIADYDIRL